MHQWNLRCYNSIHDKTCIICVMQCETHKCFEGPLINKLHFAFNIRDQINTDGWKEFFCFLNLTFLEGSLMGLNTSWKWNWTNEHTPCVTQLIWQDARFPFPVVIFSRNTWLFLFSTTSSLSLTARKNLLYINIYIWPTESALSSLHVYNK